MPRANRHFLPGAYAGDFDSETDVLRLDNTIRWQKNAESTET